MALPQLKIDAPKFSVGQLVKLKGSIYSFKISEVIYDEPNRWRYRVTTLKNGCIWSRGTISEYALMKDIEQ